MTSNQPLSPVNARTAVRNAREAVREGEPVWYRKCLKFVRSCWELPPKYLTAREAWEKAEHKHPYTGVDDIPFGAPVFTHRPNAGSQDSGHVIIAGGYNRHGVRVFRSVDIIRNGVVSAVPITVFTEKWGHEILGWTEDLNGYRLQLPPIPKRRK